MKKLVLVAMTAALIAGCGKKDKPKEAAEEPTKTETVVTETTEAADAKSDVDYMIESCQKDNEMDAATCGCVVNAMADGLKPENFNKLVEAAKSGGDPEAVMEEIMGDGSDPEVMMEVMAVGMGMMECDPEIMQKMGQ